LPELDDDSADLVQAVSLDESDGINPGGLVGNSENLPPVPKPCPVSAPLPKTPSYLPPKRDGPPVFNSHFGTPNGISFLNDSPLVTVAKATLTTEPVAAGPSGKHPVRNQGDVLAAMVLCKLGAVGNSTQTLVAPIATRPSFSPKETAIMPSFSTGTASAFDPFEPISLQSMDKAENQELLEACCPMILQQQQEEEEESSESSIVTPINFAEV